MFMITYLKTPKTLFHPYVRLGLGLRRNLGFRGSYLLGYLGFGPGKGVVCGKNSIGGQCGALSGGWRFHFQAVESLLPRFGVHPVDFHCVHFLACSISSSSLRRTISTSTTKTCCCAAAVFEVFLTRGGCVLQPRATAAVS